MPEMIDKRPITQRKSDLLATFKEKRPQCR